MATELQPNPHAMKAGDVVSEADETSFTRPPRKGAVPIFPKGELLDILKDLQEARGYLNINLNLYPLRHLTLRDWQERFDRAIGRLERLVQDH